MWPLAQKNDVYKSLGKYAQLFKKCEKYKITHRKLHIPRSCRALLLLNCELTQRALAEARLAIEHIKSLPLGIRDCESAHSSYVRSLRVQAWALFRLGCLSESRQVLEEALAMDPNDAALKELQMRCEASIASHHYLMLDKHSCMSRQILHNKQNDAVITLRSTPKVQGILPGKLVSSYQVQQSNLCDVHYVLGALCNFRVPTRLPYNLHQRYKYQVATENALSDAIAMMKVCTMTTLFSGFLDW